MFCLTGQDSFSGFCCDEEADKLYGCKSHLDKTNFCIPGSDVNANGIFRYTKCAYD